MNVTGGAVIATAICTISPDLTEPVEGENTALTEGRI
jgi:hypothetical protein